MNKIANEIIVHQHSRLHLKDIIFHTRVLYFLSLLAFFFLWDQIARSGILGTSLVPPFDVAVQLYRMSFEINFAGLNLGTHIWMSLQRVLYGFTFAAIVGIPLGLIMALSPTINAFIKPIFDFFKPMPPIAWVSIALLWFGIGEISKIFIIFLGSFVPCLLNSYNGVRLVDPELYDVIKVLGGKRKDEILQICFPAALPSIFAGLQIAMGMAWTCVLAAELLSSRNGIGFLIKRGMDTQRPDLVLGGMIIIAFVSWITCYLLEKLEKKLCPWKRSIDTI